MNRRTFLAACSALPLLCATGFSSEPTQAEINRLIEQLGSKRFKKRQAASQALNELGETAWPALLRAAEMHPDAEVRCSEGVWNRWEAGMLPDPDTVRLLTPKLLSSRGTARNRHGLLAARPARR